MFFLALMLPILSFIGQQNQENRSMAAGVNNKCIAPSSCGWDNCKGDCVGSSDLVCYGSGTNRTCKIKSGGYCNSSAVCYSNHYCSRTNNHCRKIDSKWIGDYSVEGVSVQSMLGGGSRVTQVPTNKPTTIPTRVVTQVPTNKPTTIPTRFPTKIITPTGTSLVKEIILSPDSLQLKKGDSYKITVETVPVINGVVFLWQSSDARVATVDTNGLVFAKNEGETIVTVKVVGTNIYSEMKVEVKELVESSINFKFSFFGITPGAKCISEYLVPKTKIELDIANIPSISSGKYVNKIQTSFEETDEVDSKGNKIFKVTGLTLDKDKFGSVNNFNYIKIKGPWHLKRRMCQDGQDKKLAESTVCDINLKASSGKMYDFSEYTLLAGDVTGDGSGGKNGIGGGDGVINSLDLVYVKNRINPGAEISCGRQGDLNMDGVVNTLDLSLVKYSLTERDDE